jgi:RNA polymerase sigma-70 factor (ECF subfamily)
MVQETFLAALDARHNFMGQSSEKTWFVGILKHKILNHIRKNSREYPIRDMEPSANWMEEFFDQNGRLKDATTEWVTDPSKVFEQNEFWEVLERCMSKLPSRLATAFLLREMDDLSSREICNVLNISRTNLRVILHRARMSLRRCLETKWFGKPKGLKNAVL